MKNVIRLLTGISQVSPAMLDADFWLDHMPNPDQVLLDAAGIQAFNQQVYQTIHIPSVFELPDQIAADQVRAQISKSKRPTATRYSGGGDPLDDAYYARLLDNAAPDLPAQIAVQFGLVIRRTSLRAFPTADIASSEPLEVEYDMFQETTLDTGWAVAVLATSRDADWYFCLAPHYWGWVQRDDVALGSRAVVEAYAHPADWVTVLSSQGLVGLATGGGITPQMGTQLPLISEDANGYRVQVPTRTADGHLEIVEGGIRKTSYISEFTRGYLPLTPRHLLHQAFALLGERYAWGCSRVGIFGRDCSRLIKDVYATAGVQLPRNADEQENVSHPIITFNPDMSATDRKAAIVEKAMPGDIVYMPGHVMLYVGHLSGEPYVIHDKGSWHECVLLSTLMLNEDTPKGALLHRLTSVGRVWS